MLSLPDQSDLFENIAQQVYQKGFCICENALPSQLSENLTYEAKKNVENNFTKAAVGRAGDYEKNASVRRDSISWIDTSTEAGIQWLQWTDSLKAALNRRLFLGLFSFESHFALYEPGGFYKKHVDAFRGKTNRKLSVVTYLNQGWRESFGGELVIYSEDGKEILKKVTPYGRTLVVFLSEAFPHEVLPASLPRYSIAGWYHVNTSDSGKIDPPC